jgi:hypothetical protein
MKYILSHNSKGGERKFVDEKDALYLVGLDYTGDGGFNIYDYGFNGRTDDKLDDVDLFNIWKNMIPRLSKSKQLDEEDKVLISNIMKILNKKKQKKNKS